MIKFLKALPLIALLVSPFAWSWDKIGKSTYAVYGTKITQSQDASGMLTPFAEIVYDVEKEEYGISFMESSGQREILEYGIFNMRVCGLNAGGAIVGSSLEDSDESANLQIIFKDCKRPMFIRVWDLENKHVTYKFENTGPIQRAE